MRNLIAVIGALLITSTALAAPAPKGNGNFRRAEVMKAAGARSSSTHIVGLTTAANRVSVSKLPRTSRILMVEHPNQKVDLVRAPLDRSQPVTRMTTHQANAMGLVTQPQARAMATHNGGEFGTKGTVKLADGGIGAKRGSYVFWQKSPKSVTTTQWGTVYRATNIQRAVSVTGKAESATATMTPVRSVPRPMAPTPR